MMELMVNTQQQKQQVQQQQLPLQYQFLPMQYYGGYPYQQPQYGSESESRTDNETSSEEEDLSRNEIDKKDA